MKPRFFKNDLVAEQPPIWRILFEGLWGLADRAGRLEDRPLRIKAEVLPFDNVNIEEGLSSLDAGGLIKRYTTSTGQRLIAILCWSKHGRPWGDEPPSTFPGPDGATSVPQLSRVADALPFDDSDGNESVTQADATPTSVENAPKSSPLGVPTGYPVGAPALLYSGTSNSCTSNAGTSNSGTSSLRSETPSPARDAHAREDVSTRSTLLNRFEQFWQAYPRKEGRGAALRSWERLKPNDALLARMLAAISEQRQAGQWTREHGRFIPHPKTWLNEQRWLDERPESVGTGVSDVSRHNLAARDEAMRRLRGVK